MREALQYSLNIPAIRALHRTGIKTVRKYAVKAGFSFINGDKMLDQAGLAGAIGTVEVRPVDMVAAFGAFGNGGKVTKPRFILKVEDSKGNVIYEAGDPATTQVWSPQTAFVMADILKGNTNPAVNNVWGPIFELRNTPDGSLREMAVKTGTTNNLKDYSTYGFLPIPKGKKQPALAVGVWYGNSDSSSPNLSSQVFSMDTAGRTWHAFVRDYTKGWPAAKFQRPASGIVATTIDMYTGGAPGAWTRGTRTELFVKGTQPGGKNQVDPAGLDVWLRRLGRPARPRRESRRAGLVAGSGQRLGQPGWSRDQPVGQPWQLLHDGRQVLVRWSRRSRRQLLLGPGAGDNDPDQGRGVGRRDARRQQAATGRAHVPAWLHRQAGRLRRSDRVAAPGPAERKAQITAMKSEALPSRHDARGVLAQA